MAANLTLTARDGIIGHTSVGVVEQSPAVSVVSQDCPSCETESRSGLEIPSEARLAG